MGHWFSSTINDIGWGSFIMVTVFIVVFGLGFIGVLIAQLQHLKFDLKHKDRPRVHPLFEEELQPMIDGFIDTDKKNGRQ